jgi:DNA-binding response OmpR family regulator
MGTIFFAHDQQEAPDARKNYMELAGYTVRLFKNQKELLAAFKEVNPDLVLLDVLIEGKNGFETALEISQRHPERTFPIVLCSHIYRARVFREEALRCGAQDFLLLPLPLEEFLRRINQAIAYFVPPASQSKPAVA